MGLCPAALPTEISGEAVSVRPSSVLNRLGVGTAERSRAQGAEGAHSAVSAAGCCGRGRGTRGFVLSVCDIPSEEGSVCR